MHGIQNLHYVSNERPCNGRDRRAGQVEIIKEGVKLNPVRAQLIYKIDQKAFSERRTYISLLIHFTHVVNNKIS